MALKRALDPSRKGIWDLRSWCAWAHIIFCAPPPPWKSWVRSWVTTSVKNSCVHSPTIIYLWIQAFIHSLVHLFFALLSFFSHTHVFQTCPHLNIFSSTSVCNLYSFIYSHINLYQLINELLLHSLIYSSIYSYSFNHSLIHLFIFPLSLHECRSSRLSLLPPPHLNVLHF